MDPALRAALSRGFEDVGVPGEAGAEGGLSAARRDQQYLDPGLRAAMAAMESGGGGGGSGVDEDEGCPSAARRTARRMDPALRAALARGIEEAGAADEEEAEGGPGMLRGGKGARGAGGGVGATPRAISPCSCRAWHRAALCVPLCVPLGERCSLAAPQRCIM